MQSAEDERKRELLSQIQMRIWSQCVTIRISRVVDYREHSWNTATGLLLKLGGRRFVVTAWHVLQKFDDVRNEGDVPVIVIGNVAIAEPAYVFLDERNDVVVLDVSEFVVEAFNAVPYRPSGPWPPERRSVGDPVMICGFPAILRADGEEILHGDLSYFGEIESVSEHQFVVQVQGDLEDAGRVPFPDLDSDFGGLSGCPAFAVNRGEMHLAGIFSQTAISAPVWIIRSLAHLPADLDVLPSQPV